MLEQKGHNYHGKSKFCSPSCKRIKMKKPKKQKTGEWRFERRQDNGAG